MHNKFANDAILFFVIFAEYSLCLMNKYFPQFKHFNYFSQFKLKFLKILYKKIDEKNNLFFLFFSSQSAGNLFDLITVFVV